MAAPVRKLADGAREFTDSCWVPAARHRVFEFFCDPKNLERITPPWLRFQVLHQSTPDIREGTEFDYRLRIRGIPARWRSRIESWRPGVEFADVQIAGPYDLWHHTHGFEDRDGGTLLTDRVRYRLPGGRLINALAGPFVDRDVRKIFRYRKQVITELYGS